jgi:hypothetical protein
MEERGKYGWMEEKWKGYNWMYRLHTAILNWPLSSAATMEVQGPDTTWRGIQGLLFLACWWCTICIFWPLLRTRWQEGPVGTPPPPSNLPRLSPPPPPWGTYPAPCKRWRRGQPRGRRPQIGLEEDVETILGFSAPLYEVRELSWRPAQVDQRASS